VPQGEDRVKISNPRQVDAIQTTSIYRTRCTVIIRGKPDGTGIASAAVNCSGPRYCLPASGGEAVIASTVV